MKLFLVPAILLTGLLFYNFTTSTQEKTNQPQPSKQLSISADVQKIIDNSCFGCHNAESKNEKGKGKLMFETLDTLSVAKLVGKLADISEEVDEDKMPPAKFLEFKPEAKLSPMQKEALIKWANTAGDALLKK
ncbi:MAG: heme-binding domain-containing protein [Prolixibacteraceae bacterium]